MKIPAWVEISKPGQHEYVICGRRNMSQIGICLRNTCVGEAIAPIHRHPISLYECFLKGGLIIERFPAVDHLRGAKEVKKIEGEISNTMSGQPLVLKGGKYLYEKP